MATLTAATAFDTGDYIASGSLFEVFVFGTVVSATSSTFTTDYSDEAKNASLTLTGTLADYVDDVPTSGTITDIVYGLNGSPHFTISGLSFAVEQFNSIVRANDIQKLFQTLLAGADQITGSAESDALAGFDGNDAVDGGGGNDVLAGGLGDDVLGGGAGDDVIAGDAGTDTMAGGAGGDIFRGTAASLSGDTISDMGASDRIVIQDASLSNFTFSVSGNTLTYTGGSLTLASVPAGLVASVAVGGGVQISVEALATSADYDVNGDSRSDVIWRHSDGSLAVSLGQPNGSFVSNAGSAPNPVGVDWQISGVGDFNGDRIDDLLWRHSSGEIGEWLGHSDAAFSNNGGAAANAVDNSWAIVGIGDYNGDRRDDILWRHNSGEVGQWLGMASGGFANNGGAAANVVDNNWTVVANGDFNGDGRTDALWRHTSGEFAVWQGSASGALVNTGGVMAGATGSIVGSGDFNGDGRDDVLARAANGSVTLWSGQANGQFASSTPTQQLNDPNWKIVGIGDYNGDSRDDLLWRNSSGATVEWVGTATGDFTDIGAVPAMDTTWQVQSPDILLV